MDVGIQLELVVNDSEMLAIGRQPQKLRVRGWNKGNPPLEFSGIHRVSEGNGRHHLFKRGVGGVLIELFLRDLRGKWLSFKREIVVFELDGFGQKALASHRYLEGSVHRPVGCRLELQALTVKPNPISCKLG